jgi:hypothetical protein
MHTPDILSPQLKSSFKCFAKYLVDLHKLQTFNAVTKSEDEVQRHIATDLAKMDSKEMQIVVLMQQVAEIYARDRQLKITGRNPFEVITEMTEAGMKNGITDRL